MTVNLGRQIGINIQSVIVRSSMLKLENSSAANDRFVRVKKLMNMTVNRPIWPSRGLYSIIAYIISFFCHWLFDGDRFKMLMTFSISIIGYPHQSFQKHKPSQTSVTNIVVTDVVEQPRLGHHFKSSCMVCKSL